MTRLSIIGAGSWGTALSMVLAPRFDSVRLWAHDPDVAGNLNRSRENTEYLPGFVIPGIVEPTHDLARATADANVILLAVPSQYLRGVLAEMVPGLRGEEEFVSATKGIEAATLSRMSQVIAEEVGRRFPARVAVLSGPTFAREVARGEPAALVISSEDRSLAAALQKRFSGPAFRLYTNDDPAGVETGAALKNVIAIGAGIVHGLGLGNNTAAALVTRGLAEITRLAIALGGRPETLSGLAGLGDLLLTCTGELSRNRKVGIELARGHNPAEILASSAMIPEGVETTYAAVALAQKLGICMPITEQMNLVLRDGKPPRDAIRDLMDRALRSE